MNIFSLILFIFTGISLLFWCISKLYILMINNHWDIFGIFCKLKNFQEQSNKIYFKILSYSIYIYKFITSMCPVLILVCIIRSFIFEPFQIPSGSMMPTLLIGDFILVKKFVYGIKNPINQKTLIDIGHPKRGDVIVFKYPKDPSLHYIKRVIGEPGDKVVYNLLTKQLIIYPKNGSCSLDNDNVQTPLSILYSNTVSSDFIQKFYTSENGMVHTTFIKSTVDQQSPHSIRLMKTTEAFDGHIHDILTMIPPGDFYCMKMYDQKYLKHLISEWTVPVGEYFVMGDNRDNSSDSRCWGYVPERNVVGQAIVVWMSIKKLENGWPGGIQLDRIGTIIQ